MYTLSVVGHCKNLFCPPAGKVGGGGRVGWLLLKEIICHLYSKRKEFALLDPLGANTFSFRVDPFTKRLSVQKSKEIQ